MPTLVKATDKLVGAYVDPHLVRVIDFLAREQGLNRSQVIRAALAKYVSNEIPHEQASAARDSLRA